MNMTSSDVVLVSDIDYLTVVCHVSYVAAPRWTPSVQCLPDLLAQTEMIKRSSGDITCTYMHTFKVVPELDDIAISCTAMFNFTGRPPRPNQALNTTDSVYLWKSPSLHVQCKQFLLNNFTGMCTAYCHIKIQVT